MKRINWEAEEIIELNCKIDRRTRRFSITIFALIGLFLCSVLINTLQHSTIEWLKEPYNIQVIQNAKQKEEIDYIMDLKHNMQMEFLYYNIGKSHVDSINRNIEKEYDFIKSSTFEQLVQKYSKDEYTLGNKQ